MCAAKTLLPGASRAVRSAEWGGAGSGGEWRGGVGVDNPSSPNTGRLATRPSDLAPHTLLRPPGCACKLERTPSGTPSEANPREDSKASFKANAIAVRHAIASMGYAPEGQCPCIQGLEAAWPAVADPTPARRPDLGFGV
jgi:hypothetical protein